MKEIKDETNRWRDILCSWIGRINIVKMIIQPKEIYSQCNPIKLLITFFTKLEQKTLNLHGNTKDPQIAKAILRKKSRAGRIKLPDFGYTTNLQSSKQYGTGTKIEISGTG